MTHNAPPKVDPVEAYIRQRAAEAPPLSAVQRATIADLLRSAPAGQDDA